MRTVGGTIMPDSLDPMDALLGSFADVAKRALSFVIVGGGAYVLGTNMHDAPTILATLPARGPAAFLDFFEIIRQANPFAWIIMMFHSAFIWYLLPFVILVVVLLVRLWRDGDVFNILLTLALTHSVHSFIYAQRSSPLPTGDLIVAAGLLFLAEIAITGLVLWWRHVRLTAPALETESEPEL